MQETTTTPIRRPMEGIHVGISANSDLQLDLQRPTESRETPVFEGTGELTSIAEQAESSEPQGLGSKEI